MIVVRGTFTTVANAGVRQFRCTAEWAAPKFQHFDAAMALDHRRPWEVGSGLKIQSTTLETTSHLPDRSDEKVLIGVRVL